MFRVHSTIILLSVGLHIQWATFLLPSIDDDDIDAYYAFRSIVIIKASNIYDENTRNKKVTNVHHEIPYYASQSSIPLHCIKIAGPLASYLRGLPSDQSHQKSIIKTSKSGIKNINTPSNALLYSKQRCFTSQQCRCLATICRNRSSDLEKLRNCCYFFSSDGINELKSD